MAPEPFIAARAAELFQASPHTVKEVASEHTFPDHQVDHFKRFKTRTFSELLEYATPPLQAKINIGRDAKRSGTGSANGGRQ